MNKRLRIALKKTILISAVTHLVILAVFSFLERDPDMINIFNILDFDLFFPTLGTGVDMFVASYVFIVGVVWYFYNTTSSGEVE